MVTFFEKKADQKAKRPRIPNFTFVFTNLASVDQLVEWYRVRL